MPNRINLSLDIIGFNSWWQRYSELKRCHFITWYSFNLPGLFVCSWHLIFSEIYMYMAFCRGSHDNQEANKFNDLVWYKMWNSNWISRATCRWEIYLVCKSNRVTIILMVRKWCPSFQCLKRFLSEHFCNVHLENGVLTDTTIDLIEVVKYVQ